MKKHALLLFTCMILIGCSKPPAGAKDSGYQGIRWGASLHSVAQKLGTSSHATNVDALFSGYRPTAPKLGALMEKGFAHFLTGKSDTNLDAIEALKGMTMLDQGKAGYSLFFNGRFGMNVRSIPASDFQSEHNKLMKRYGLIDKKADYIPDEYNSSYFIMWHDADGKIFLAKQVYRTAPDHEVTTVQVIHMDKRVYDLITSELPPPQAGG